MQSHGIPALNDDEIESMLLTRCFAKVLLYVGCSYS